MHMDPEEKKSNNIKPFDGAIGISFGNSNSAVAVYDRFQGNRRASKVEVICNDYGNRTTPSFVAWTSCRTGGEILVGDPAKNIRAAEPQGVVYDLKYMLGEPFSSKMIQSEAHSHWPFEVVEHPDTGEVQLQLLIIAAADNETINMMITLSPQELVEYLLRKLKSCAEDYLGKTVHKAVLTVPHFFNDHQRQILKEASENVGLTVLRLFDEDVAACLAYDLNDRDVLNDFFKSKKRSCPTTRNAQETPPPKRVVLVLHVGGTSSSAALLEIDEDGLITRKESSHDLFFGGKDIDDRLVEVMLQEFTRKYSAGNGGNSSGCGNGCQISENQRAIARLRTQCERMKQSLSKKASGMLEIDALHNGIDFYTTVKRQAFTEEICGDLLRTPLLLVDQVLTKAGITSKTEVDDVVLRGGTCRIPRLQELVTRHFGTTTTTTTTSGSARTAEEESSNRSTKIHCAEINADEVVASGAAIKAWELSGAKERDPWENCLISLVLTMNLGIEIPHGLASPYIDWPLSGSRDGFTPPSSGIMVPVLQRNIWYPVRKSKVFTVRIDPMDDTTWDFKVNIFEGQRAFVKNNFKLGSLTLPLVVPPIATATSSTSTDVEVTFAIDTNETLTVTLSRRVSSSDEEEMKKEVSAEFPTWSLGREAAMKYAQIDQHVKEAMAAEEDSSGLESLVKEAVNVRGVLDKKLAATQAMLQDQLSNVNALVLQLQDRKDFLEKNSNDDITAHTQALAQCLGLQSSCATSGATPAAGTAPPVVEEVD